MTHASPALSQGYPPIDADDGAAGVTLQLEQAPGVGAEVNHGDARAHDAPE